MLAPSAVSPALATSETASKKPSAATSPRLAARARTRRDRVPLFGSARHIRLSAVCISPNTPEAVASSVTSPTIVATMPEDLRRRAGERRLQHIRRLPAHEPAQLIEDCALRGLLPEDKPGDGNHDEENGGKRGDSVERNRGAAAQGLVVNEPQRRVF